ncbi:patatin-like phospholipase family protein [Bacillus sp. NEB1478]|uniref:patatin-like phospholipase family protein n=1 Tax=Bacillus sp. NEB1478 TaxID=3073816 RepID=UPI002872BFD1|nr:patatin-like phospholipase family protein [Bacillus sp. NEB1478]WNB93571.1 patatin-like phospholipase family protein [Bacillus sp. NEB1478]
MRIDGVFSGGGIKALSLIGAVEAAEDKGLSFERVAGTSAGALMAALIKAGYKASELKEVIDGLDFRKFLDKSHKIVPVPFTNWLKLYWKLGLFKGDYLENWVAGLLANRGIVTFADIPAGSLKIIASDISRGRLVVIPDDLEEYGLLPERFPIARAVRMSCSLPYFFYPIKLFNRVGQKSYIVDGGVLSNFPMWLFQRKDRIPIRPVLGFQLSSYLNDHIPAHYVKNAFDLFKALFETMMQAHDNRYIDAHDARDIIFMPVKQVSVIDFQLSAEAKNELYQFGYERAEQFLQGWMNEKTYPSYKNRA